MKSLWMLPVFLLLSACFSTSNRIEPAPLKDLTAKLEVREIWSQDFGSIDEDKYVRLDPVLRGGTLYAVDSDGDLTAFDQDKGDTLWGIDLDREVTAGLGASSSNLFLGTRKGQVVAISIETHKIIWQQNVSSQILAPPVTDGETVIVQTIDGKVHALSEADGKSLWVYRRDGPSLSLRGTATPLIVQDAVVTGFSTGTLSALSLDKGRQLWEMTVAHPQGRNEIERLIDVDIQPLVKGYLLFVGSYQGKLVAIDLRSGRKVWSRDISTFTGLAVDDKNIYVTDDSDSVWALEQTTGSTVWRQGQLQGRALNAPAVMNDYIVVGDYEGYVHWLSTESGAMVTRYQVGNDPIRSAAIVDGFVLYVSNIDGDLAAVTLQ